MLFFRDNRPLQFEWDEQKNELNIQKHHISFETAMLVFQDKKRVERMDWIHSNGEKRYHVLGRVGRHILFVVFTFRSSKVRMISARYATKEERRLYL